MLEPLDSVFTGLIPFIYNFYDIASRFGSWCEVVIDDQLPTRNGKLLYLKADEPNEFWTPLLEKAYAKFYGSYQSLESGTAIEAAVDFTGGIPEYIDISEIGRDGMDPREEEIFLNLERAFKRDAFLSCSMSVGGVVHDTVVQSCHHFYIC